MSSRVTSRSKILLDGAVERFAAEIALAQFAFEQLAAGVLGQAVGEDDTLRYLEVRHGAGAVPDDGFFVQPLAALEHDGFDNVFENEHRAGGIPVREVPELPAGYVEPRFFVGREQTALRPLGREVPGSLGTAPAEAPGYSVSSDSVLFAVAENEHDSTRLRDD